MHLTLERKRLRRYLPLAGNVANGALLGYGLVEWFVADSARLFVIGASATAFFVGSKILATVQDVLTVQQSLLALQRAQRGGHVHMLTDPQAAEKSAASAQRRRQWSPLSPAQHPIYPPQYPQ